MPLHDEAQDDDVALPFPHEDVSPSPGPSTSSLLYSYPIALNHKTARSGIIHLNIGGVLYTTTKATLVSRGSNFFGPLLDGQFGDLKDDTDAYFIDRNGRLFGPILDYLRQGVLNIPTDVKIEQIVEEAKYYAIDLLPGLCGDIKEGLYTSNNWILFFERDPDHPWIFGITGTPNFKLNVLPPQPLSSHLPLSALQCLKFPSSPIKTCPRPGLLNLHFTILTHETTLVPHRTQNDTCWSVFLFSFPFLASLMLQSFESMAHMYSLHWVLGVMATTGVEEKTKRVFIQEPCFVKDGSIHWRDYMAYSKNGKLYIWTKSVRIAQAGGLQASWATPLGASNFDRRPQSEVEALLRPKFPIGRPSCFGSIQPFFLSSSYSNPLLSIL